MTFYFYLCHTQLLLQKQDFISSYGRMSHVQTYSPKVKKTVRFNDNVEIINDCWHQPFETVSLYQKPLSAVEQFLELNDTDNPPNDTYLDDFVKRLNSVDYTQESKEPTAADFLGPSLVALGAGAAAFWTAKTLFEPKEEKRSSWFQTSFLPFFGAKEEKPTSWWENSLSLFAPEPERNWQSFGSWFASKNHNLFAKYPQTK